MVSSLFDRHVPGGGAIETPVDCFEYELLHSPPPDRVVVRGYLPLDGTSEELRQRLQRELWLLQALYPIAEPIFRRVAESDWAEAWKQQYHLQRIGQRIVIVPAWEAYEPASGEVVIRLEPGMAFGTGLHPTTRLCLQALDEHLHPECSVLDVGTGSGVLAIAAAKLGARSVLALDADPVAVTVARENIAGNDVAHRVHVQHGTLPGGLPQGQVPEHFASGGAPEPLDSGQFDLVLVNIFAPVIVGMAPALAARLNTESSRLIVAGLIETQETEVADAFGARGLQVIGRSQEQDWVALVARRR